MGLLCSWGPRATAQCARHAIRQPWIASVRDLRENVYVGGIVMSIGGNYEGVVTSGGKMSYFVYT